MSQQKVQGKERPNIFKRIGLWASRSWAEFKKVNWPSFSTVIKNLGVVLFIVGLFLIVVGAIDSGLLALFKLLTGSGS